MMRQREAEIRKAELRRYWQRRRAEIPAELREKKSRIITGRLLDSFAIGGKGAVFAYISFRSEPETHGLIRELLDRGVRVAVPLCDPFRHTMKAVELREWTQLRPGSYGILEPDADKMKVLAREEIGLVLVPGLAFDRAGFRLGYGGGYYDRYLADWHGTSIGLTFSECLTAQLPQGDFDIPVSRVLTDEDEIEITREG